MAFFRSSALLRKAITGRRTAAVYSSYTALLYGSPCCSDRRRCYSSLESGSKGTTMAAAGYHINNGPSYMKGAVFWETNKPLTFEDFNMPRPKANEILIKTKACGVCHSDLHVMKGELPFASPCVVGHEITGEVVEHGSLTDSRITERLDKMLKFRRKKKIHLSYVGYRSCIVFNSNFRFPIGSQVVGAFIMPCGSCSYCAKGQDDLCEPFFAYNRAKGTLYDGETRLFLRGSGKPVYMYSMGGLAEYCVVPAHGLTVLPNTLPYTESAILGCAIFTAYGAMTHAAQVHLGDAIAVIGLGGVGSSCVQIARASGASKIIAVDVQDDKLEKAKTLGATHAINARKEDAVSKIKEITGGKGVDIAVEALGRTQTFSQCFQSVCDGGKAVMIGLTLSGAKGEVDINHLVRRQIKVIGSYGGRARQDLPKLVELAETGIFNLESAVSRKYKFEEAAEAYKHLDQGSILGRAVVEIM